METWMRSWNGKGYYEKGASKKCERGLEKLKLFSQINFENQQNCIIRMDENKNTDLEDKVEKIAQHVEDYRKEKYQKEAEKYQKEQRLIIK